MANSVAVCVFLQVALRSLSRSLSQQGLSSVHTQTLPGGEEGGLHPSESGCIAPCNELDGDEQLPTATLGERREQPPRTPTWFAEGRRGGRRICGPSALFPSLPFPKMNF